MKTSIGKLVVEWQSTPAVWQAYDYDDGDSDLDVNVPCGYGKTQEEAITEFFDTAEIEPHIALAALIEKGVRENPGWTPYGGLYLDESSKRCCGIGMAALGLKATDDFRIWIHVDEAISWPNDSFGYRVQRNLEAWLLRQELHTATFAEMIDLLRAGAFNEGVPV